MLGLIFVCILETDFVEKTTLFSTVLAFVCVIVVICFGLKLNHRFLVKLREEKRARPLGRKGNVIEPIASLFCIIQMIYWPYNILFTWIFSSQIFPPNFMIGWHATVLWNVGIKMGRTYIACNSLFTSLIRYIYIVHHERSNQWEFEKVGKLFCIASVLIPITVQSMGFFTSDMGEIQLLWPQKELIDCFASHLNVNSTNIEFPYPTDALQLTRKFLPESVIDSLWLIFISFSLLIYSNLVECILYVRIFQTIKRSNMNSHEIGVLSDASYKYAEKRSIISLKMCILGWIYELTSNVFVMIAPILKFRYHLPHTYFVDPISMFVVIPFLYLFNDDDTKEIIYNESWYQGIKYVLGVYVAPVEKQNEQIRVEENASLRYVNQNRRLADNYQRDNPLSTNLDFPSQLHRSQHRLFNSLPDISVGSKSTQKLKLKVLRRHYSYPDNLFQGKDEPENFQVAERTSILKKHPLRGSDSSLKTLNID